MTTTRAAVLVADDDIADHIARVLRAEGFTDVDVVTDGSACLESAAARHYDLILLNHRMPGLRGHEVLHRLRQLDVHPRVVVISASGADEIGALYDPYGVMDYVEKPFSNAFLVGRCRRVIAISRSAQP